MTPAQSCRAWRAARRLLSGQRRAQRGRRQSTWAPPLGRCLPGPRRVAVRGWQGGSCRGWRTAWGACCARGLGCAARPQGCARAPAHVRWRRPRAAPRRRAYGPAAGWGTMCGQQRWHDCRVWLAAEAGTSAVCRASRAGRRRVKPARRFRRWLRAMRTLSRASGRAPRSSSSCATAAWPAAAAACSGVAPSRFMALRQPRRPASASSSRTTARWPCGGGAGGAASLGW